MTPQIKHFLSKREDRSLHVQHPRESWVGARPAFQHQAETGNLHSHSAASQMLLHEEFLVQQEVPVSIEKMEEDGGSGLMPTSTHSSLYTPVYTWEHHVHTQVHASKHSEPSRP